MSTIPPEAQPPEGSFFAALDEPARSFFAALDEPARSFFAALDAEQDRLAAVLAEIRADRESGELTAIEAARNWVEAAEAHLARVRKLRRQYGDE